jgi:hypothetical protein
MFLTPETNPLNQGFSPGMPPQSFSRGAFGMLPATPSNLIFANQVNTPGNVRTIMLNTGGMIRIVSFPSLGIENWYYPDGTVIQQRIGQ